MFLGNISGVTGLGEIFEYCPIYCLPIRIHCKIFLLLRILDVKVKHLQSLINEQVNTTGFHASSMGGIEALCKISSPLVLQFWVITQCSGEQQQRRLNFQVLQDERIQGGQCFHGKLQQSISSPSFPNNSNNRPRWYQASCHILDLQRIPD